METRLGFEPHIGTLGCKNSFLLIYFVIRCRSSILLEMEFYNFTLFQY